MNIRSKITHIEREFIENASAGAIHKGTYYDKLEKDLHDVLLFPDEANDYQVSDLARVLLPSHASMLIKLRPELIKNFNQIKLLLKYALSLSDKELFCVTHIDLLKSDTSEKTLRNIRDAAEIAFKQEDARDKFITFAKKKILFPKFLNKMKSSEKINAFKFWKQKVTADRKAQQSTETVSKPTHPPLTKNNL